MQDFSSTIYLQVLDNYASVHTICNYVNQEQKSGMDTNLDPMLETEKLPAGVTYLNSCLTDVDGKALSHI